MKCKCGTQSCGAIRSTESARRRTSSLELLRAVGRSGAPTLGRMSSGRRRCHGGLGRAQGGLGRAQIQGGLGRAHGRCHRRDLSRTATRVVQHSLAQHVVNSQLSVDLELQQHALHNK
jgi:hypothetical protein